MLVQEGIFDDLIQDIEGTAYRFTVNGILDEPDGYFAIHARVTQSDDQALCEIRFTGVIGSFELGGFLATAASLYGWCVAMKLTPALGRLAYDSYRESVAAETLSRADRVKNVFQRFIAKKEDMKGQAVIALGGCLTETIDKFLPSLPGGKPKEALPLPSQKKE